MSKTDWGNATWNANGELVVNIHKEPQKETKNDKEPKHTYAEVDCGGECGGCVGLIVDGEIVDGPFIKIAIVRLVMMILKMQKFTNPIWMMKLGQTEIQSQMM